MAESTCTTKKKQFSTKEDAVAFHTKNQQTFGGVSQYAYLCEDCGSHHLSTMEPGDTTLVKSNYSELGKYNVTRARRTPEEMLELQKKVRELQVNGMVAKDIAAKLGIDIQLVYSIRNLKTANSDVEKIEEKQLNIQEQIAKLQREFALAEEQKKLALEMREPKAQWSEDLSGELMLVITQNQNRFTVTHEDAEKLYKQIGERLAQVGTVAAVSN